MHRNVWEFLTSANSNTVLSSGVPGNSKEQYATQAGEAQDAIRNNDHVICKSLDIGQTKLTLSNGAEKCDDENGNDTEKCDVLEREKGDCSPSRNVVSSSNVVESPVRTDESSPIVISDDDEDDEVLYVETDITHIRSKFDWIDLDGIKIPCIYRNGLQFVSLRMVDSKFLSNFVKIEDLNDNPVESFHATEAEAKLLTDINVKVCNSEYQGEFTTNDLLVKFLDFKEFYFKRKFYKKRQEVTGGWLQVNSTCTPFVMRNDIKFVPLSVIRLAAKLLTQKDCVQSSVVSGDELLYLNELCLGVHSFGPSIKLISVDVVKSLPKCEKIIEVQNPFQNKQTALPSKEDDAKVPKVEPVETGILTPDGNKTSPKHVPNLKLSPSTHHSESLSAIPTSPDLRSSGHQNNTIPSPNIADHPSTKPPGVSNASGQDRATIQARLSSASSEPVQHIVSNAYQAPADAAMSRSLEPSQHTMSQSTVGGARPAVVEQAVNNLVSWNAMTSNPAQLPPATCNPQNPPPRPQVVHANLNSAGHHQSPRGAAIMPPTEQTKAFCGVGQQSPVSSETSHCSDVVAHPPPIATARSNKSPGSKVNFVQLVNTIAERYFRMGATFEAQRRGSDNPLDLSSSAQPLPAPVSKERLANPPHTKTNYQQQPCLDLSSSSAQPLPAPVSKERLPNPPHSKTNYQQQPCLNLSSSAQLLPAPVSEERLANPTHSKTNHQQQPYPVGGPYRALAVPGGQGPPRYQQMAAPFQPSLDELQRLGPTFNGNYNRGYPLQVGTVPVHPGTVSNNDSNRPWMQHVHNAVASAQQFNPLVATCTVGQYGEPITHQTMSSTMPFRNHPQPVELAVRAPPPPYLGVSSQQHGFGVPRIHAPPERQGPTLHQAPAPYPANQRHGLNPSHQSQVSKSKRQRAQLMKGPRPTTANAEMEKASVAIVLQEVAHLAESVRCPQPVKNAPTQASLTRPVSSNNAQQVDSVSSGVSSRVPVSTSTISIVNSPTVSNLPIQYSKSVLQASSDSSAHVAPAAGPPWKQILPDVSAAQLIQNERFSVPLGHQGSTPFANHSPSTNVTKASCPDHNSSPSLPSVFSNDNNVCGPKKKNSDVNDIHIRYVKIFNGYITAVLHSLWRGVNDWFISAEEIRLTFFPHIQLSDIEYVLSQMASIPCMRMTAMEENALCAYYGVPPGILRSKFMITLQDFQSSFAHLRRLFGLPNVTMDATPGQNNETPCQAYRITNGKITLSSDLATQPASRDSSPVTASGRRKRKPSQPMKVTIPAKSVNMKDVSNVMPVDSGANRGVLESRRSDASLQKENLAKKSIMENDPVAGSRPNVEPLPSFDYGEKESVAEKEFVDILSFDTPMPGNREEDDDDEFGVTISDVVSLRDSTTDVILLDD